MFSKEKADVKRVPMMPVRDMVIFPEMMHPFIVGREASVRALEDALAGDKKIFLVTQHDASVDDPKPEEIYQVGTLANIVQSVKLPDGNIKVLVEGTERAKIVQVTSDEGFFRASVRLVPVKAEPGPQIEQASARVTTLFEQYVKLSQSLNYDTMIAAVRVEDPGKLSDAIAANLQIPVEEKQELLEIFEPAERLNRIADILEVEIEKLNVDRSINTRVKRQMERAQKEYYLNEKLKAIQKELGRGEANEIEQLKKKIETSGMPEGPMEKAMQELKKLEAMPPMSAESTVSRNYLDWLLAVPWKKRSKEIRDIKRAEQILSEDHYGLEKIKERILEYLAVRQIIQMMRKAGTTNPVFVLDEVDKMSMDFRGDPSAALMEVLDPELNHSFTDHYLDVEYDLSKVMFICTANVLHTIPQPLQDRMEVLRLPGYTEQEKHQIAQRFLVSRELEATGLTKDNLKFTDESITHIIRHYTHEAGVRNLDREIANVCRKVARKVVGEGKSFSAEVTATNVNDYLGILKYRDFFAEKKNEIGLTTGLAWTEVGGQVLSTEATLMQGKGRLTLTGKLGDVMQESAQAGMSYVRSRSHLFGLPKDFYRHIDIHIHVPEGAIPKDGPSAGITLCTSIVSALTRIPVRCDVAMTGEITLRGKVLPIGGVKEKLLAAHRLGLRTLILPKDNEKDLADIPPEILTQMSIHFVESMDQVLEFALEKPLPIAGHPPVAGVEPKFGADVTQDNELAN